MREYCVARNAAFDELEDLYEVGMGYDFFQTMSAVFADALFTTPSAQVQASSNQDVFS